MKVNLSQRLDRAKALKLQGYNCAQCVTMVFDDVTALDANALSIASAALGGGIGGTKETCGTVTGMAIANGCINYKTPADKQNLYRDTAPLVECFRKSNGSVICSELRQPGKKSCMELIFEAITLLHNHLEKLNE